MTNDPEPDDVTKNMITRMTPTDVMVATGEEKNNGGSTKKGSRLADSPKRCSSLLTHNGVLPSVPVSPHPAAFVPVQNAFLALESTVDLVGIK
ncbi:hypothetical protein NYA28ABAC_01122 [Salinicola sp. NYA28a]